MHATTPNLAARQNPATSTRVDGASLAVARMAFGAVAVFSAARTVRYGWIESLYAGPTHRFTYLWMGWVPQPAPAVAWVLVAVTALAGVAIALGWRTRAACAVLLVSFGWIEFTDATTYLNHYWFVTLLAALGLVVPFGRTWSLDARRSDTDRVARGWVWLLRFQVGLVYASAGLAKLQADWLLRAEPLRYWLPARADTPVIGGWLRFTETAHLLSVAGAVFDCAIVPLLLWRRTRLAAWLALVAFHVATWSLFPIGIFPWLMIAMATVFFDPSWPRTALATLHRWFPELPWRQPAPGPSPTGATPRLPGTARWLAGAGVALWVLVQLALPLRHLAYPGDHRWTAEGYRFGWNVLLVERVASVTFLVHEPATGRTWTADPATLYTETQLRAMAGEPDLIHQAAKAIAAAERADGREVEVRADAWLSLNGRPAERWLDPTVDLAAEPRGLGHKTWILPAP